MDSSLDVGAVWRGGGFLDVGTGNVGGGSASNNGVNSLGGGDDVLLNNDVYKQKLRSAFIEQQNSLISGRHRNSQTRYSASRPTMGLGTPRSLQQQQQQPAVGWQPAAAAVQRTTQNNHQDYSIDVAAIQSSRATAAVGVTGRQFVERSGLYRSNSSLELQRGASADVDDDNVAIVPMRRDFGSDNSLDMVDSRNPNFPAIVQNYRINLEGLDANGISDERTTNANAAAGLVAVASKSPPSSGHGQMQATNEAAMSYSGPPPEIQGASMSTNGISPRVEITSDVSSSQLSMGNSDKGSRLKRSQKSKSERKAQTASDAFTSAATPATGGGNSSSSSSSGGIFRKLRGVKSDPSAIGAANRLAPDSADRNPKVEERQRRKAFNHYDCQSIGVSLADVIKRRTASEGGDSGSVRRTNTTTGASAASGQQVIGNSESGGGGSSSSRLQSPEDLTAAAAVDQGDGKSNELVQSCLNFLNELGGEEERAIWIGRKRTNQSDSSSSPSPSAAACRNGLTASQFDLINNPSCNGVCILDASAAPLGTSKSPAPMLNNYVLEYIDQGAYYYRNFFNEYDHQNYFGIDDSIGPVAVSIRRERSFVAHDDRGHNGSNGEVPASTSKSDSSSSSTFQYRIIVRTSELTTLRGSILEDCIPSTSKLSSARGLSPKDILEYVVPSLNTSCLRHAVSGSKDQLQKLDEQRLSKMYKIGIMLCRAEQSTEEEMYNNECSTPLFDEFLDFIGKRVLLKNFEKYRGGLDHKTDSTGLHSVYASFEDYEIMFHVSTLLPFTPNNRQQLLRKRHIGNDIVTIVFQEPGALPFTPKSVRSQFQHVFIIVRAMCSDGGPTKYSVAVSRLKNVPYFGPPFSKETVHEKTDSFRDFLLAKAINAENAVHCTDKFIEMATRTRRAYLQDLASNCVTAATVDTGSRLGKFSLGSGRKKDKSKLCCIPDVCSKSAVVWSAAVEDDSIQSIVDCFFAVAHDIIVIVEDQTRKVIFTTLCKAVIGWTALHEESILRIYYNQGECVTLHMARSAGVDEIKEIISRLEYVSDGCKTEDLRLQRSSNGQLGFHVGHDGVVTNVEPHGSAAAAGLRPNSRLVCVCERFVATLSHEQVIDLLRTEKHISITYVPPRDDGRVRSATRDHLEFGSHQLSAGSGEQKHDQDDNNHMSTNGDVLPPRTSAQTSPSAVYGVAALSPPGLTSIGARDTVTPYYRTPTSAYSRQAVYDNGYVWNELNQGPPPLPMPPSNVNLRSNAYHGSEQTIPASADGQLNFYPAYSRESMKGPSHKFDASQSSSKTGCSSAPRISTTSSSRPSTATESGRPVPPPKPIFASDDPGLTVSTLGRYSKRNPPDVRGLGADWHSGSSPESVARRYGSEHDTTVNSSDELHSSRGELPRQDQFAGHRQGSVTGMSSPASQCSSSTGSMRHGSSRQLWSNHDLATTSDRHEQHSTSPLLLEPMSRSRTLTHRSSPNRLPTSASGTFNSEVMRPNAMANNDIHRTLSDKSNRRSGVNFDGSNGSTGHLSTDSDQRSNQRTNIDIPGTAYRLRANPSALTHNNLPKVGNLPLPDGPAENIDWNSLVAAAKKTFEGSDNANTSSVGGGTLKASRSVDVNNSMTAINRESPRDRLDSHNLQDIANDNLSAVKRHYEARIDDLERQLDKERQEREFLENEMNGLRQQNARLLEESQAAAAQLRRFSGWFFNTIDKR